MREIKIFLISAGLVFLMTALPHFRVRANLINPLAQRVGVFDSVSPKLSEIHNSYKLTQNPSIVGKVEAAADYDGASSYALVDFDSGQIISQKNLSQRMPIASLTKIMTAVVALDLSASTNLFTYTESGLNQTPTRLAFTPGDKLTLEELLNGLLLTSANDCAQVIKEGIDQQYGGEVFIRAMNEKAKSVGLKNTHFGNPQGYDGPSQYSSVEDLSILTHYALTNYPLIASIVAKDHGDLPPTSYHTREEYLNNWNGLMGVYPGVMGVKIGNTDDAKYTTDVVSEREGKKLMAILLGAPGVLERDQWTAELLDSGFSRFNISAVNVSEKDLKDRYATWKYFK